MRPDELDHAGLTEGQRAVLDTLGHSELRHTFYLSGGSAIGAFYLHHRASRDLDLFTPDDVPVEVVRAFVGSIPRTTIRSFHRLYDRRIFLLDVGGESLEVEFTKDPFPRVDSSPRIAPDLAIDSARDLVANKIVALADRQEPKDEVDLFCLLRAGAVRDIEEATRLAETKFGVPGLRYILQRRLLAVSASHPVTAPPIDRDELVRVFGDAARQLVASSIEG